MTPANQNAVQRKLAAAVQLHNRGQLDAAAREYERLVASAGKAWEPRFLLGLLRFQQGELAVAQPWLTEATQLNARHADAWYYLGETLAGQGQTGEAEAAFGKASARRNPHPMASFRLAELLQSRGAPQEARAAYERAILGKANFPEALNNLGLLLRAAGETDQAEALFRNALRLRSDFIEAYINLAGVIAEVRGDHAAAMSTLELGQQTCPPSAELHFHLAVLQAASGQSEAAVASYEQALALNPDHASAYNNVGVLFLQEGFPDEARVCFERAASLEPDLAEAYNNLGNVFTQLEQLDAARGAFGRALALRPTFAEAHNGLGIALSEGNNVQGAAEHFRAALERRAAFPEASANLAAALHGLGRMDEARAQYKAALALSPSVALRIKAATMLPAIPTSLAQLLESRAQLEQGLDALLAAGLQTCEQDLLSYPLTCFYLAYHGLNDRTILEKNAALYAAVCPSLLYRAPHVSAPRRGGPVRIGFVSRYFHNHSVGNFFNPIIEKLAGDSAFEVYLFAVGPKDGQALASAFSGAREYVPVSRHALQPAREAIEQRELDILVYADLGMDPFTYFLSFSRLAARQSVLQGHSDTSGVAAVDDYIGSRLTEPADGQDYYSERLVLLDTLPMVLREYAAATALTTREALGLPVRGPLYLCPMKLHKIHPDMDELVARILERDPHGRVVFIADDIRQDLALALQQRLTARLGSLSPRAVFIPYVNGVERFRQLLSQADVILDTPHHGGGTTVNLALSVGTPVVTLRGTTSRGLGTTAFYRLMGIDGCVAQSADEYVSLAVSLANDAKKNQAMRAAILANRPRMIHNEAVVHAYAQAFRTLFEQCQNRAQ